MSLFYLNGYKMDKLRHSGSVEPVLSDEMKQQTPRTRSLISETQPSQGMGTKAIVTRAISGGESFLYIWCVVSAAAQTVAGLSLP